MSRLVCWFSCGAASAVATKLAIVENAGRLPVVVARCIVREEHPDNDRFADDCDYQEEPEVQCGIFCHMAQQEIS